MYIYTRRILRGPDGSGYRGTSLLRTSASLGPYSRTMSLISNSTAP